MTHRTQSIVSEFIDKQSGIKNIQAELNGLFVGKWKYAKREQAGDLYLYTFKVLKYQENITNPDRMRQLFAKIQEKFPRVKHYQIRRDYFPKLKPYKTSLLMWIDAKQ